MKKLTVLLALLLVCPLALPGCGGGKETVLIYTSADDYRVAHLRQRLE